MCATKIVQLLHPLNTGSLEEAFEDVEAALYRLEDLNETLELQNKQLDHRFQLALYKEKKLAELDSVRGDLSLL